MSLSPQQRALYARHLLLPEIGLPGQERLLAASVSWPAAGDVVAGAVARTYAQRAGLCEAENSDFEAPLATAEEVAALAGRPELMQAAGALAGAVAAVESLKRALSLGAAASPLSNLSLSSEDV
jgi:hypothetical protein